ncbi:hypothetical protein IHQ68_07345 [Chelatococcus sambhunathii]|uniref:Uncharacterized protein n=1 Tax=Chelatococcus sambhunathii TaxID=363953 RepID=A0ABU1DEE3_9HYPH|nr:hypothetical protein [Chelatococcus sambhunathii]MDR4306430.1 hypothetical protein [Chelatococcus sambhunathii]
MFYVYDVSQDSTRPAITLGSLEESAAEQPAFARAEDFGDNDIDFVDDALLNTTPHNRIEQQLLRGDVVGLALMSGAILWSAMGAFG